MAKILYFITGEDDYGIKLALENKEDEVTIMLLQNAVYFATKTGKDISEALSQNKKVYALKDDVDLRGIKDLLHNGIETIDYSGVIDKTFENKTVINF